MGGMTYAFDTNIVSYLLKKDVRIQRKMETAIKNEYKFVILPVVYYEVSRWLLERKALRLQAEFEQMCAKMPLIMVTKEVLDGAASLYVHARQIGRPIGSDADILIASFCLVNNYTLITNNVKHFDEIKGLRLINWKD